MKDIINLIQLPNKIKQYPTTIKPELAVLLKSSLTGLLKLYILTILACYLIGVMSGFIYGTELQQVRAYNTMIYSFQKIKAYDMRFKMPEETNVTNIELDTNIPPELMPYFEDKVKYAQLMDLIQKNSRGGIIPIDYTLPDEAYQITINGTIIKRPTGQ
jgi:hypothetical protein